ncbi:MAG: hypothetical protein AB7U73_21400 [Pirellulales bacterium]
MSWYPCCCPSELSGYGLSGSGLILPEPSLPPQPSGSDLFGSGSRGPVFRSCACCNSGRLPGGGWLLEIAGITEEAFPAGRCLPLNRGWVCDQQICVESCMLVSAVEYFSTDGVFDYYGYARVAVSCPPELGTITYLPDVIIFTSVHGFPLTLPFFNPCGGVCGGSSHAAASFSATLGDFDCTAVSGLALTPTGECLTCGTAGITGTLTALAA